MLTIGPVPIHELTYLNVE